MCIEVLNNEVNMTLAAANKKKVSYSVKKLLKLLFKQHKSHSKVSRETESHVSLESLENMQNAETESETTSVCLSLESYENEANERLSACQLEAADCADVATVPVHFVRTANGTFFWTASPDVPADNDLVQPLYCCTTNQIAVPQYHERWAQA